MHVVDTLTLDPADFLPNGAELDLTAAGFQVLDADFGDADVEQEMMRQALGETPTSYHPPNTVTTLKLSVRKEGEVDLPTAAHELAQKVGEINTPGTEHWLRRDFDYKAEGEFAGSLGKRVYKATLSGMGGWQRGDSPDVTLTLVTGPYWYMTTEGESEVFESAEGARELIGTIAETLGTAPGLIRFRITNLGEEDLRGLILAIESRDMAQDATADTTAALAYDAVDLTLFGEAKEDEREGVKVVRHKNIPNIWLSILGSEISAEKLGSWTHKGTRRMWARIWDPGTEAGLVQLRLEWRVLGTVKWSQNAIVSTPLVGDWALVDLGECRPEPAALGDERWESRIAVRTTGTAGADLDIQRLYPLPTEQFALVRQPVEIDVPTDLLVSDAFNQSAGNATGKTAEIGGVYGEAANSDATDFTIAGGKLKRASTNDTGTITKVLEGRGIGTPTELADLAMTMDFSISAEGEIGTGVRAGQILGYVSATNFISIVLQKVSPSDSHWLVSVNDAEGENLALARVPLTFGISNTAEGKLLSLVRGNSLAVYVSSLTGAWARVLQVDNSLVGVKGKCYLYDENSQGLSVTRGYDNLAIWEPELPVLCSGGRSIEPRSDGIFRQDPEDDVWGQVIPEGFLPYASPSGLEGRKSRFIMIPTQGDLGELADSGDNALSAQVLTRAAYHVAREAV